jgi:hypothetical protein
MAAIKALDDGGCAVANWSYRVAGVVVTICLVVCVVADSAQEEGADYLCRLRGLLEDKSDTVGADTLLEPFAQALAASNEGVREDAIGLVERAVVSKRISREAALALDLHCREIRGRSCLSGALDRLDLFNLPRTEREEIYSKAIRQGVVKLRWNSGLDCRGAMRWASLEGMEELRAVIVENYSRCSAPGTPLDELLINLDIRRGAKDLREGHERAVEWLLGTDPDAYVALLNGSPHYRRVVSLLLVGTCESESDKDSCDRVTSYVEAVFSMEASRVVATGKQVWCDFEIPCSPDYWWARDRALLRQIARGMARDADADPCQ